MKKGTTTKILLTSAVAGLMALAISGPAARAADDSGGKAHCYGINKCKGTGGCSGAGHSCAGHNACDEKGHINLPKDVCLRIKGGHLTPKKGEED